MIDCDRFNGDPICEAVRFTDGTVSVRWLNGEDHHPRTFGCMTDLTFYAESVHDDAAIRWLDSYPIREPLSPLPDSGNASTESRQSDG